jgi:hypothetical protein
MKTYTAQIIYRIKTGDASIEQYDEQWRLVYAADERDALDKAREIGKEEEAMFVDRHGRTVQWSMVAIKDMQEVEVKHGALLHSNVREVEPITAPVWEEE